MFVLVSVFLGVNFIRPSVLAVIDQKEKKVAMLAELSAVEKTAMNIGSLSSSRKSLLDSDDGKLIMLYLPERSDQDRIVDILNYFGVKSGVSIGNISFSEAKSGSVANKTVPLIDGEDAIQGPPPIPTPLAFSVSVVAAGSYDSLKSFVEEISTMNRLQEISTFSLENRKIITPDGEQSNVTGDDMLTVTIDLSLPYLPMSSYPGAHLLPVFDLEQINIATLKEAISDRKIVQPLSEPTLPDYRSNPFAF